MRARAIVITAIMVSLYACGGSGGGTGDAAARDNSACEATGCEPESPVVDPTPVLSCSVGASANCPDGYRCIDDTTDQCDPARGDADCAGLCVLGEELPGCGMTQAPCPAGTVCVDDPTDACDGGADADCPGTCQPQATGTCTTDADCPALPAVCETCADGSFSCPLSRCDNGLCIVDGKPCERPVSQCGGVSGAICPPGMVCVDDPNDSCDEKTGADCPGLCQPSTEDECTSDADCAVAEAPCNICPDGLEVCPTVSCINGRCSAAVPPCDSKMVCGDDGNGCPPGETCVVDPNTGCDPAAGLCKGTCVAEQPECRDDSECAPVPGPCRICPDGLQVCATVSCVNGRCSIAAPPCDATIVCGDDGNGCAPGETCVGDLNAGCDPSTGFCKGRCVPESPACIDDSECVQVYAPCIACADGTFACPRSECRNGLCTVTFETCAQSGSCGGLPGFPCPPGLTCVDDPNDECDPKAGAVDCKGMCVRDDGPQTCGGLTGSPCPDGYDCVDDPADDCDPNAAGSDCPGICRPAPPPGCESDDQCVVGAPCHLCADGSAACPRGTCINGGCEIKFETCAAEP